MSEKSARVSIVETALGAVAVTMVIPTSLGTLSTIVKVKVPFDFYVGNRKLPADTYMVSVVAADAIRMLDDNRNRCDGQTISLVNCALSAGKLVFNLYVEEHFLSEVQWSGRPF